MDATGTQMNLPTPTMPSQIFWITTVNDCLFDVAQSLFPARPKSQFKLLFADFCLALFGILAPLHQVIVSKLSFPVKRDETRKSEAELRDSG